MSRKLTILKETYLFFNSRYFRGKLPDIPVVWVNHDKGKWMARSCFDAKTSEPLFIQMKSYLKKIPNVAQLTLLHEMVHIEQAKVPHKQMHGRKFQKRMKQLAEVGAFNLFW